MEFVDAERMGEEVWCPMKRSDFTYKHKIFAELAKGKVLDIGYAQEPNPFLKNAVGLDIQKMKCPTNYSKTAVCNLNTDRIPFPDKSFDTVIMGDVIEHLENPTRTLLEVNRVLKKNGRLLISTPNAAYYWNVVDDWFFLHLVKDPDPGEHLADWTRRDFIRLLKKNGFSVNKMYGAGTILPIIHLRLPNKHFPIFGWIVIYRAVKIKKPNREIIVTRNEKSKGRASIKQEKV